MTTPPPYIQLDERHLWEVASEFRGCGYSQKERPGYPESFLDALKARSWTYLQSKLRERWRSSHQTNCCMFAETVIVGAAMKSAQAHLLDWRLARHNWANVAATGQKETADLVRMWAPLQAYVDAGVATMAAPDEEPGDWCVCQSFRSHAGGGHTFLIVKRGAGGQCLTLEANVYTLKNREAGYVGHRAREINEVMKLAGQLPTDWEKVAPTWEEIKASNARDKGLGVRFARLHVTARPTRPALPFDRPKSPPNPTRYFFLNEAKTRGGYYPVGAFQNLHGGVHLSAAQAEAHRGVRCLAPGYIVALRFAQAMPDDPHRTAPRAAAADAAARELSGNHHGFVLVRHQARTVVPKGEASETFTFYTLSMHLAPPRWDRPGELYREVSWVRRLGCTRGSVANVDPQSPGFRKRPHLVAAPAGWGPVEGGAFAVYRSDRLEPEAQPFQAARRDGVAASAVLLPPDEDLKQAHDALVEEHGRVVTFTAPYLPVSAGELLGAVAPASGLDEGFLHWEALGPKGDAHGLKALMRFAERALGADGLFQYFSEKTADNYLDPDQEGDLDKVLALLPPLPAGHEASAVLPPEYDLDRELVPLLKRASPLPFASEGATPPARQELVYPLALKLTPFKPTGQPPALPRGAYRLRVEFLPSHRVETVDYAGGDATVRVMVPADTESLRITPEGFRLLRGTGERALSVDVRHLREVTRARWRNVVLDHVNEWDPRVLATTLKARLGLGQGVGTSASDGRRGASRPNPAPHQTAQEMDAFADAAAWWNHREKPVTGEHDTPLFGGGPGALPPATDLEQVHPVTLAWVLDLLVRHRKIELVTPPWESTAPLRRTAWAGWAPVTREPARRRVGEGLWAVALSRGVTAVDAMVTLQVSIDGKAPLAIQEKTAYQDGVAAEPVSLQLWGRASIVTEPAAEASLGANAVVVERPVLAAEQQPPVLDRKRNVRRWGLRVERNVPVGTLDGWVLIKTRKLPRSAAAPEGDQGFEPFKQGIPIVARAEGERPDARGFVVEGGYYVRGPAKRGTCFEGSHFTYGEFCAASPNPKKPEKVAVALVAGLERLRGAVGKALTLTALAPSGLEVTAHVAQAASRTKLKACAESLGAFTAVAEEGTRGVRVAVAAPAGEPEYPGWLTTEFDLRPALAAVREALAPAPDEVVYVRCGVMFANGGSLRDRAYRSEPPLGDVTWAASLAPADRLEAWAGEVVETVSRPGFGRVSCGYVGRDVSLSVPLHGGDGAFWREANPAFVIAGKPYGAVSKDARALQANLSMEVAHGLWRAHASAHAAVRKNDVKFHGRVEHVADSEAVSFSTAPSLRLTARPTPGERGEGVAVVVEARALFGRALKYTVRADGASPQRLDQLARKLAAARATRPGGDGDDRFVDRYETRLAHAELRRALPDGAGSATFELRVELLHPEGDVGPAAASVDVAPPRPYGPHTPLP
ncbi:MAG: hypothetical protein U0324_28620 [Polyangiales bacterium]